MKYLPLLVFTPAFCLLLLLVSPRWFLHHWDRLHSNRTISHGVKSESEEEEDELVEDEFEDDVEYLRSLDPKETKDQDHYRWPPELLDLPVLPDQRSQ